MTLQESVRSLPSGTTGGGVWGETLRVLGMTDGKREKKKNYIIQAQIHNSTAKR